MPNNPETIINEVKVGDNVRSWDFPDIKTDMGIERVSFVEGVLQGYDRYEGCRRYVITVNFQILGGKEVDHLVGRQVFPPVNGTPSWAGDVTNGVERA